MSSTAQKKPTAANAMASNPKNNTAPSTKAAPAQAAATSNAKAVDPKKAGATTTTQPKQKTFAELKAELEAKIKAEAEKEKQIEAQIKKLESENPDWVNVSDGVTNELNQVKEIQKKMKGNI